MPKTIEVASSYSRFKRLRRPHMDTRRGRHKPFRRKW